MKRKPTETFEEKLQRAENLATRAHEGQRYDNEHGYLFHLEMTYQVAKEYNLSENVQIAAWLHDIIEDTLINYSDVKRNFNLEIAELVYAVTDELGRNRKERHQKTFPKIIALREALGLKLADRIANTRWAVKTNEILGRSLLKMYQKEYSKFKEDLLKSEREVGQMWIELDKLMGTVIPKVKKENDLNSA